MVLIFSRTADEHLASLVKALDELNKDDNNNGGGGKLGVLVTGVGGVKEEDLQALSEKSELKSATSVSVDADGPANYKLNKDAAVTVVIYQSREKPTTANFAFKSTEEAAKAAEKVAEAAKKATAAG